ncbi:MAG TPA: hypothetical protein VD994_11335 [Prosthecobacter sp.]|nr:hypothetical protein [Prosthecobacter sp.]
MKTILIGAVASFLALANLSAQSATTTVTTSTGTLHQYVPGSTFVVNETTGPVAYNYGPDVVYATRAGTVLTPEQVQARIRVGAPVHVEYVPQGETRVIRRVLIDDDDDDDDDN